MRCHLQRRTFLALLALISFLGLVGIEHVVHLLAHTHWDVRSSVIAIESSAQPVDARGHVDRSEQQGHVDPNRSIARYENVATCNPKVLEYGSSGFPAGRPVLAISVCGDGANETLEVSKDALRTLSKQLRQAETLMKSVALFSASPVHVALIAETDTFLLLLRIFQTWPHRYCKMLSFSHHRIYYPHTVDALKYVDQPCASQRLFLPLIFPHSDLLISVDIDVVALAPIEELWAHFERFDKHQIIGAAALAVDLRETDQDWRTFPKVHHWSIPDGISIGVLLVSLARWRTRFPNHTYDMSTRFGQYGKYFKSLARDLFNVWLAQHPDVYYDVPCTWNLRPTLCQTRANRNSRMVCSRLRFDGAKLLHTTKFGGDAFPWNAIFRTLEAFNLSMRGSYSRISDIIDVGLALQAALQVEVGDSFKCPGRLGDSWRNMFSKSVLELGQDMKDIGNMSYPDKDVGFHAGRSSGEHGVNVKVAHNRPDNGSVSRSRVAFQFHAAGQELATARGKVVLPRSSKHTYNVVDKAGATYLLYQPTGGFTNQLHCLEAALYMAIQSGRRLILPMVGKHTNLWEYSRLLQKDWIAMDRVLDVDTMEHLSAPDGLNGVVLLDIPLYDFVRDLQSQVPSSDFKDVRIRRIDRPNFAKSVHSGKALAEKSRFLFFSGLGMFAVKDRHSRSLRYAPGLRYLAAELVAPLGLYHAVHIRLGDRSKATHQYGHISKTRVEKLWEAWVQNPGTAQLFTWNGSWHTRTALRGDLNSSSSSLVPSGVRKLYIATDAVRYHGYFDPLCRSRLFECIFAGDLNKDVLAGFHAQFASQKFAADVFGVVEQLICVNAIYFLGTLYDSTFTRHIYRMRETTDVVGFTFPEATLTNMSLTV